MSTSINPKTGQTSCQLCKKRKVRCDKEIPCSGCVRAGIECVPGTRASYRPRRRLLTASASRSESCQPTTNLKLETLKDTEQPHVTEEKVQSPTFGQNLWSGFLDEFRDPQTSIQPGLTKEGQSSPSDATSSDPSILLFGLNSTRVDFREEYPSPLHAFLLWQVFLQNVNPLSKIIHVPSVQDHIVDAASNYDTIPIPTLALLFSIYAAAVMSLDDQECQKKVRESKNCLLHRYLSATQRALVATSFMHSKNLIILQALAIFSLAARQVYDPQATWIVTGIALRMAQKLNHRSPQDPLSAPTLFETEMRRRVWWQILCIDGWAGKLAGQGLTFTDISILPLPTNLNDSDINPSMSEIPEMHERPTEMIFCLINYEVGLFLLNRRKWLHSPTSSVVDRAKLIDDFENMLENKYLKHYDPAIPLHQLAYHDIRSIIFKMRLMANHPWLSSDKAKSMSRSDHDMIFSTSFKIMDHHILGYSMEGANRFRWHMDASYQLDAFVFMLVELQSQLPTAPVTEKAWILVSEVFRYHPQLMDETDELHLALRRLVLRAWDTRELEVVRRGLPKLQALPIVTQLREKAGIVEPNQRNSSTAFSAIDQQSNILRDSHLDSTTETTVNPQDSHYYDNRSFEVNPDSVNDVSFQSIDFTDWESWDYWDVMLNAHVPKMT